jgi:MFS family permease
VVAIILAWIAGFYAARYIRSVWLMLFSAIVLGIASSIAGAALTYIMAPDMFHPPEIVNKAVMGLFFYPLISIVSALISRRASRKKNHPEVTIESKHIGEHDQP